MGRLGKIARLPENIRAEVNQRLRDGEPGREVVAWLNGLPEVQRVVASDFGGKAVREQNLSEWRQTGYSDWLLRKEIVESALRLHGQVKVGQGSVKVNPGISGKKICLTTNSHE